METTIRLDLEGESLPDIGWLGELTEMVLASLPEAYDPNFGPRYIIDFVAGDSRVRLDFSIHTLRDVREQRIGGTVLLGALGLTECRGPEWWTRC